MQQWYMLGLCGGAPYTPPSLPGRISQWSVKAAQRLDLYEMKRGSPLISPSTDQRCNMAKGNEDAPEKKPWIYFIIPCSQTFHGYPTGMRLHPSAHRHSDCVDTNTAEVYGEL
ncbi:hypothetical protein ABVT39_002964 [Epinephelus coioides]